MKKFLGILAVGICFWYACSDDDDPRFVPEVAVSTEKFVDASGREYPCIEVGDQIWMAENLAWQVPGGTLAGCYTWDETLFDTTDIVLPEESGKAIRDAMLAAYEEGKIDDTPCKEAWANNELGPWGMAYDPAIYDKCFDGTGTDFTSIYYINYMGVREYAPILWLKEHENPTFTEISENFYSEDSHFYLIYSQTAPFVDELRVAQIPEYAKEHLTEAETQNGYYSETYGLLYSYDAAKQAVPAEGGWRLPTDEDWKKLEKHLGMSDSEANVLNEWRGTEEGKLLKKGEEGVGFKALLAGGQVWTPKRTSSFLNQSRNAYFWTSENIAETDSTRVGIIRSVAVWGDQILRTTTRFANEKNTPTLYSVRLVKDKE